MRTITIGGFAVLFGLAAVLAVVARVRPDRLAAFTELVAHLSRRRAIRLAILGIWAWLGWHFLAR